MWQLKNSNCDKTQILKLWQNSETKIETKLKNQNIKKKSCKKFFGNNNLTPWLLIRCFWGSLLRSRDVFHSIFVWLLALTLLCLRLKVLWFCVTTLYCPLLFKEVSQQNFRANQSGLVQRFNMLDCALHNRLVCQDRTKKNFKKCKTKKTLETLQKIVLVLNFLTIYSLNRNLQPSWIWSPKEGTDDASLKTHKRTLQLIDWIGLRADSVKIMDILSNLKW